MWVAPIDAKTLQTQEVWDMREQYYKKFGEQFIRFNYATFERQGEKCAGEIYVETLREALKKDEPTRWDNAWTRGEMDPAQHFTPEEQEELEKKAQRDREEETHIAYKILCYFKEVMDLNEPDLEPISHKVYKISMRRWKFIMEKFIKEQLVDGIYLTRFPDGTIKEVFFSHPHITAKGLEYLKEKASEENEKVE